MNYDKLEIFLSKPRLERFLIASHGSKEKAIELYKANILLSEAYYPILSLFESFLRNFINRVLINHFHDADWILTQKLGFMNDPYLKKSSFFLKESVTSAESKLARKGVTITSGRIIAEQSLGFWTSFFDPHHYKLLSGSVIHCFPLTPKEINRKSISIILKDIRDFRNRVYHNEPICFNSSTVNLRNAEIIHQSIYNLLSWMDGELPGYVNYFDKVLKRIESAKRI